ncbi:G patch domain and ankyrin repeat-containing protein 1-like protein [Senna tora]|uniref:G patch domain and ankyrin repeat-containing protein 1-like protein n=1 Tax=Senna tora TaxID=362788 RepID=A0A834TTG6_9FABA|nr:G patch domain and ankyrin repeat-containing protein 1-like protein [Senna tora]
MEEELGTTASATTINPSNIGFQLLKKHGWKEGTGLGISEQSRIWHERLHPLQASGMKGCTHYRHRRVLGLGSLAVEENIGICFPSFLSLPLFVISTYSAFHLGRLEPVEAYVKNNKLGLGADSMKKKAVKTHHANASEGKNKQEQLSPKKKKPLSKRMRKMQELEKKMQEKEFERAFFREFWPENV